MMKTRHVNYPRSAIIVFRFNTYNFGEVSGKASYADIAYAVWVSLRTPHIFRSGLPRGKSAVSDATTDLFCFVSLFPLSADNPIRTKSP